MRGLSRATERQDNTKTIARRGAETQSIKTGKNKGWVHLKGIEEGEGNKHKCRSLAKPQGTGGAVLLVVRHSIGKGFDSRKYRAVGYG